METASLQDADGEKVGQFAATLINTMNIEKLKFEASPDREQIFVNPDVWARFTLYRSVMTLPIAVRNARRNGAKSY